MPLKVNGWSMSGLFSSLLNQREDVKALDEALQKAAALLCSRTWDFQHFSNSIHDVTLPNEPPRMPGIPPREALAPLVSRFSTFDDDVRSYELNENGLDQLQLDFDDLGSGQLVARLYNHSQPGDSPLAETYLVSLVAEPGETFVAPGVPLDSRRFTEFELSFIGTEDQDGSDTRAIGSLNLDSEILSLVESTKIFAGGTSASGGMILASDPLTKEQCQAAEVASLAQERAAEFLAESEWEFSDFTNLLHNADLPNEPISRFDGQSRQALLPYVDRFAEFGDGFSGYALNQAGLNRLKFDFEDIGSGQLVARLYNELQPGPSTLAETYLVSVIAEPAEKSFKADSALTIDDFEDFELSFVGVDDSDGSQGGGLGALNLEAGTLSLVENSRSVAIGLTSSSRMNLTAGDVDDQSSVDAALAKAVDALSSADWSFQKFSNTFQDALLSGEPPRPAGIPARESLMPFVSRFDVIGDGLISYDLNGDGLEKLGFEFESIGDGQLVARLYNELQPGDTALAQTYLVSLLPEPSDNSGDLFASEMKDFELSFVAIDNGMIGRSENFGIGSFNLDSGLLSLAEVSKGLQRGLTASTDMILAADPISGVL